MFEAVQVVKDIQITQIKLPISNHIQIAHSCFLILNIYHKNTQHSSLKLQNCASFEILKFVP